MDQLELDITLDRGEFRLAVTETLDLTGISAPFGANGSGKTTLLRVIAGLEPAARGTIVCRGQQWLGPDGSVAPESRNIGYVFQEGRLFAHLDVERNLKFPLTHGGRQGPIAFDEVVATFGLETLVGRYPAGLSGGERQRVAIGRALLANPALLLMDEPLSSLDQSIRQELVPLIRQLPARYDIPVIYVTHDIDELIHLADTVVLLADGRNVARGSAREILERSDFEQLADQKEAPSVLEAEIASHDGELTVLGLPRGELRIPRVAGSANDTVRLRVQPRDVILSLEPVAGISIRNCLPATVSGLNDIGGGQVAVSLALGDQTLRARITSDAVRELGLTVGQEIFALIKTVALESFAG